MKISLLNKFSLSLISLLLLSFTTDDSQVGEFSALKTKSGIMFIYNADNWGFSIEADGDSLEEISPDELIYVYDKKIMQIVIVPDSEFCKGCQTLPDIEFLKAHKTYEVNYINQINNQNIESVNDTFNLINGKAVLFFSYNLPQKTEEIDTNTILQQFFATTRLKNTVLVLVGAVTPVVSLDQMKSFFRSSMATLRLYDRRVPVEGIRDSLRLINLLKDENR